MNKRTAWALAVVSVVALVGLAAFSAVIFSAPLMSPLLFRIGTMLIGFGGGLFAVGTLTAAMALAQDGESGLALGTWGAVQATAAGAARVAAGRPSSAYRRCCAPPCPASPRR